MPVPDFTSIPFSPFPATNNDKAPDRDELYSDYLGASLEEYILSLIHI